MSVNAVKPYQGEIKDSLDRFHGNQLLYIGWDKHLMFCAPFCFPFPPQMKFQDILEKVLPGSFGYHPEFARIDWSKAQWKKSGKPWKPDYAKSLAENGLVHKDVLRFYVPGLDGIGGSAS